MTESQIPASSASLGPSTDETPGVRTKAPRRRRRVTALVALAAIPVVAVLAVLIITRTAAPEQAAVPPATVTTVPVTTGSMVSATNARATLHYSNEAPLLAGPAGVVTALPVAGVVIAPGGTLYGINTEPVLLLRGSMPAWRSFELGMSAGEDVRQLEQNLTALGVVFRGRSTRPSPRRPRTPSAPGKRLSGWSGPAGSTAAESCSPTTTSG